MKSESAPEWPISEELRRKIVERLGRPGVTQRDVARYARVSQPMISNIARGRYHASVALPRICEFLKIDLFDYLPLDDSQKRALRALEKVRKAGGQSDAYLSEFESRAKGIAAEMELARLRLSDLQ